MKDKLLNLTKSAAIHYALFITLTITIELAGQVGYRLAKGRWIGESNPENPFKEHPYLSASLKTNSVTVSPDNAVTMTTDNHGFRTTGDHNSARQKTTIVCLGGSTTYGTYVTDQDSWPFQLQNTLGDNFRVHNLGVPGYTTVEAIVQLSTIVPPLKPDLIIVYEGWNDLRNYHILPHQPDYYWHGMTQKTNLQVAPKRFYDNFFWILLARKIKSTLTSNEAEPAKVYDTNDPYVDSLYVRNLNTIKLLSQQLNAKVIFVPQVIYKDAFLQATAATDQWTPHLANKKIPELIKNLNSLMSKHVSRDDQTIVIDSILTHYDWQAKHFVDNGHFSKEGGEFFAKILISKIAASLHETKTPSKKAVSN